ncbi:hypothetical protein BD408DRAFT_425185 [Parasitella parasitica]|nr:hypothetical protein BD408DRAFT_425185 [Parasitella parasitica]
MLYLTKIKIRTVSGEFSTCLAVFISAVILLYLREYREEYQVEIERISADIARNIPTKCILRSKMRNTCCESV